MDFAHTETDKQIEKLENRLQAEYRQAYKETKGKLEKYLSDFARKDEAKQKLVEKGELSQADYKKWRTNQMLTGQRWAKMVDTLAKDMNRTNQIAADIISGQLSPTFALNANFAAYGIENGFRTDYGFTLYDQETVNRLAAENPDLLPAPSVDIPADIRWNKQKITSNITQAVLQGKSIPEIAKTMQTVVGMNKASATRNARTAMTGAQNAGRQATYDQAKAMGIKVKKEWVATLDGRTRHSHGMADGQQVELDGKFTVGRAKMRYPGDVQNGTPEEIYNCRCTMVTREPPEILQGEKPRMTYQEWVQTKEGQKLTGGKFKQTELKNVVKSDIINIDDNLNIPQPTSIWNKIKSLLNSPTKNGLSVAEVENALKTIGFSSVDISFSQKIHPELQTSIIDQLKYLEDKFGSVKKSVFPTIAADETGNAVGSVSRIYNNPLEQKLHFSKSKLKSKKKYLQDMRDDVNTHFAMPCNMDDETLSRYVVTHEYGHILENSIIGEELKGKFGTHAELAKHYRRQINDIAKTLDPNYSEGKYISDYGKTKDTEFFAECFANSQLGQPNILGEAILIWLERRGFNV